MGILLNYKEWKKLYEAKTNTSEAMVQLSTINLPNVNSDNDGTQNDFVNQSLIDDINKAAAALGIKATITTAKTGHSTYTNGGKNVSRHMNGTGVDVAILNGVGSGGATNSSNGNSTFRELGNKLKDALVSMGYSWNVEAGNDKAVLWQTDAGGNHYNHLHISNRVGSSPMPTDTNTSSTGDSVSSNDLSRVKNGNLLLRVGMKGEAVRAVQQKLKDLGKFPKEPNSEFDKDTYNAVKDFQRSKPNPISSDGIVGPITYAKLFGEPLVAGAIQNSKNQSGTSPEVTVNISGKISHNYGGKQAQNINLLISEMEKQGITNPYSQAGILSVIAKESAFIPKNEIMNYSKERLPEVWGIFSKTGGTVPKGQGKYNYNELAVQYANQPEKLANFVYGQKPHGMRKNGYGNTSPGDGWKYRGRGFNGITFKSGYEKYSNITGLDLVSDPDKLNEPKLAAEVAVLYFKNLLKQKNIDPNGFNNLVDATTTFARANAGWGSDPAFGVNAALAMNKNFSVNVA
jgi:predicted chitinase